MLPRCSLALIVGALALVGMVGCQVIGYNSNPYVGGSSWETVERVDPVGGGMEVLIQTRASANTFFGKVMSLFGRPSLAYVCTSDEDRILRIDWREAVGPPSVKRTVFFSLDGEDPDERRWDVSESGRVTIVRWFGPTRPPMNQARTAAVRVVNSRGENLTLVFNVGGFESVRRPVDRACS